MASNQQICLIRHGETEWTLSRQHTGTTDIPLTENGRKAARSLRPVLEREVFSLVLKSPLRRSSETCELAGLGDRAQVDRDLMEWDYGDYEGRTPGQIHATRPNWMIFADGCPGGETPDQIGHRVDRVISKVRATNGNVALFAHGHFFRVLVARWLGFRVLDGAHFLLEPATLNILGYYEGIPAVKRWNLPIS